MMKDGLEILSFLAIKDLKCSILYAFSWHFL